MPRTRILKPELFKDEILAELPIPTRYFFVGMWGHADREGRLEDRHMMLKAEIYPYDDIDVRLCLNELCPRFIIRYSVNDREYIQIRNFQKHQKPHERETKSVIPKPTDEDSAQPRRTLGKPRRALGKPRSAKGTPRRPCSVSVSGSVSGSVSSSIVEPSKKDGLVPGPGSTEKGNNVQPIQRVVNAYKEAKGVGMEDKEWDDENYPRCAKAAKSLIKCLRGWEPAAVYVIGKGQEFEDKKLGWTLETIKNHAWDDRGKLNANVPSEVDVDAVLGPGGDKRTSRRGKQIVKAGEIVARGVLDDLRPDGGEVRD